MLYEQIYKIIELYNQYKGCLNDDGTVVNDAQITEWIVPSFDNSIINEKELDELAQKYSDRDIKQFQEDDYWGHYADDLVCGAREEGTYNAYKAGYRKAKEEQ